MDTANKVKDIFEYMKAIKKLNDNVVRNIDDYGQKYGEVKIDLSNLKNIDGLYKFNNDVDKENWIEINRHSVEEAPVIPLSLSEYIKNFDVNNPVNEPILELDSNESFLNHVTVNKEYTKWIEEWRVWREANLDKYKVQEVYKKLFKLYQFMNVNGEDFQLIFCDSILAWRYNQELIKYPLITNKVELKFDSRAGKFTISAIDEYSNLEIDIFEGLDLGNIDEILEIKNQIRDEAIEYRTLEASKDAVERIINYICDERTEDVINLELRSLESIKISNKPNIYKCPMIILKKKDVKASIQDLDIIINKIQEGYPVPNTIKSLISNEEYVDDENSKWNEVGEKLLFPLQANEDQKEIARRLAQNYGLVVQGPPGTGKSHTIVNLICHLLAHGKRILVTSQTEKALSVLSEKIPKEIKSLCLNVLGSDKDSMKDLDNSIRTITDNLSLDADKLKKEIDILEKNIKDNEAKQNEILSKLKEFEEKENIKLKYKDNEYSLLEVAKWLNDKDSLYEDFTDKVDIKEELDITNEEFINYISLVNKISEEEINSSSSAVDYKNSIPDRVSLVETLKVYKELLDKENDYKSIAKDFKVENIKSKEAVGDAVRETIKDIQIIKEQYLEEAFLKLNKDSFLREVLEKFLLDNKNKILNVRDNFKALILKDIVIPQEVREAEFIEDYKLVTKHLLENNLKVGFIFKLRNKKSLYVLEKTLVDNKDITNEETRKTIDLYLSNKQLINEIILAWEKVSKATGIEDIKNICYENMSQVLKKIEALEKMLVFENKNRKSLMNSLNNKLPSDIDIYSIDSLLNVENRVKASEQLVRLEEYRAKVDKYKSEYKSQELRGDIDQFINSFNYEAIEAYYEEIFRLASLSENVEIIKLISSKISRIMPILDNKIKLKEFKDLSLDLNEGFIYVKWKTYLEGLAEESKTTLEENLVFEKEREKLLILELVNKKTWYNQIISISDKNKRSLYSWLEAMKKIGKGTGKFASHYRKIAQQEMKNCKQAIPVWIMPFNKVIESLEITDELFDVVIFDESSQSDIFALQALFRAEKAVIVGDDKQISPLAIGQSKEEQIKMINLYLKDIPNKEWFDLETSLYNTALRVFPNKLMLKEHFRCVPEIIQFSNEFCYNNNIIPLRYPAGKDKFENPVIAVKVTNGYRSISSRKENIPEAEALVEQIVQCCKDKRYDGMTMGVITLLGFHQAELIENMLRERLGEKEMVNRKIVCGDSYSFQGDERDVIFLSLVIAKNQRFMALTKEDDRKRINVAASRAKNQMWLFYSVDLKDINTNCARHSLLAYFLNPKKVINEINEKRFESKFEEDVYNLIREQGYVVNTKVEVGNYKIDLVVEGFKNRLAIECEGDRWQGIEKWEEDRERQNQLERVGWVFVRVRGNEFYRNKEETMKRVFEKLEQLNLEKEEEIINYKDTIVEHASREVFVDIKDIEVEDIKDLVQDEADIEQEVINEEEPVIKDEVSIKEEAIIEGVNQAEEETLIIEEEPSVQDEPVSEKIETLANDNQGIEQVEYSEDVIQENQVIYEKKCEVLEEKIEFDIQSIHVEENKVEELEQKTKEYKQNTREEQNEDEVLDIIKQDEADVDDNNHKDLAESIQEKIDSNETIELEENVNAEMINNISEDKKEVKEEIDFSVNPINIEGKLEDINDLNGLKEFIDNKINSKKEYLTDDEKKVVEFIRDNLNLLGGPKGKEVIGYYTGKCRAIITPALSRVNLPSYSELSKHIERIKKLQTVDKDKLNKSQSIKSKPIKSYGYELEVEKAKEVEKFIANNFKLEETFEDVVTTKYKEAAANLNLEDDYEIDLLLEDLFEDEEPRVKNNSSNEEIKINKDKTLDDEVKVDKLLEEVLESKGECNSDESKVDKVISEEQATKEGNNGDFQEWAKTEKFILEEIKDFETLKEKLTQQIVLKENMFSKKERKVAEFIKDNLELIAEHDKSDIITQYTNEPYHIINTTLIILGLPRYGHLYEHLQKIKQNKFNEDENYEPILNEELEDNETNVVMKLDEIGDFDTLKQYINDLILIRKERLTDEQVKVVNFIRENLRMIADYNSSDLITYYTGVSYKEINIALLKIKLPEYDKFYRQLSRIKASEQLADRANKLLDHNHVSDQDNKSISDTDSLRSNINQIIDVKKGKLTASQLNIAYFIRDNLNEVAENSNSEFIRNSIGASEKNINATLLVLNLPNYLELHEMAKKEYKIIDETEDIEGGHQEIISNEHAGISESEKTDEIQAIRNDIEERIRVNKNRLSTNCLTVARFVANNLDLVAKNYNLSFITDKTDMTKHTVSHTLDLLELPSYSILHKQVNEAFNKEKNDVFGVKEQIYFDKDNKSVDDVLENINNKFIDKENLELQSDNSEDVLTNKNDIDQQPIINECEQGIAGDENPVDNSIKINNEDIENEKELVNEDYKLSFEKQVIEAQSLGLNELEAIKRCIDIRIKLKRGNLTFKEIQIATFIRDKVSFISRNEELSDVAQRLEVTTGLIKDTLIILELPEYHDLHEMIKKSYGIKGKDVLVNNLDSKEIEFSPEETFENEDVNQSKDYVEIIIQKPQESDTTKSLSKEEINGFEKLRNEISELIKLKQRRLTPKQLKAAIFLRDNLELVAENQKASVIGRQIGVSTATISTALMILNLPTYLRLHEKARNLYLLRSEKLIGNDQTSEKEETIKSSEVTENKEINNIYLSEAKSHIEGRQIEEESMSNQDRKVDDNGSLENKDLIIKNEPKEESEVESLEDLLKMLSNSIDDVDNDNELISAEATEEKSQISFELNEIIEEKNQSEGLGVEELLKVLSDEVDDMNQDLESVEKGNEGTETQEFNKEVNDCEVEVAHEDISEDAIENSTDESTKLFNDIIVNFRANKLDQVKSIFNEIVENNSILDDLASDRVLYEILFIALALDDYELFMKNEIIREKVKKEDIAEAEFYRDFYKAVHAEDYDIINELPSKFFTAKVGEFQIRSFELFQKIRKVLKEKSFRVINSLELMNDDETCASCNKNLIWVSRFVACTDKYGQSKYVKVPLLMCDVCNKYYVSIVAIDHLKDIDIILTNLKMN